jgi:hypothetical protein
MKNLEICNESHSVLKLTMAILLYGKDGSSSAQYATVHPIAKST